MADLRMLANEENVVEAIVFGTKKKYHIASLKPEDFKDNPEVRNKYFWNKCRSLDRFHIPELSENEYAEIAKTFAKSNKFDKKNLSLATATPYFVRKARIAAVAKDLNCSPYDIDVTDYIWDERYYLRYSFIENITYVDEMFREENSFAEDRSASANQVYIGQDPRTRCLDEELWNDLFQFCTKAIRVRKAMLLSKVESCLGFLMTVLEYTNGFTENATASQVATLSKYKEFFTELLKDAELLKFLENNNDITVFANDKSTRNDYIETYRSLCKMLIRGMEEDMPFFKEMLNEIEDPYLNNILEVREKIEFRSIYDNSDCEDDEEEDAIVVLA